MAEPLVFDVYFCGTKAPQLLTHSIVSIQTAALLAAKHGKAAVLRAILNKFPTAHVMKDVNGRNALALAAAAGHESAVQVILEGEHRLPQYQREGDVPDHDGLTTLWKVVFGGMLPRVPC